MKRPIGFDRGPDPEPVPVPDPVPEPVPAPAVQPAVEPAAALAAESAVVRVPDRAPEPEPPSVPGEADAQLTVPLPDMGYRTADVREAQRRLKQAERLRRRRERGEQRRFTEHLRRRRRVWAIVGLAIAGLAVFVAVGVFTPLMAVREVQVVGAAQVDEAALQTAMSRFVGTPLALVDDQEVHRALEPFPLIERYAIERIPPQTLVLRIEEREAVVAMERDGAFALYDAAGVLIGASGERPEGVPLAAGTVLDTGSPAFQAAARVIRDMPGDLRAGLAAVEATTPEEVTFTLTGGTQVVWGSAEDTQRKAMVLRSVIASLGFVAVLDVSAPETPVFR